MGHLTELGFGEAEERLVDPHLAELIAETEASGLEGVAYPAIIHLPTTATDLEFARTVSPLELFGALQQARAEPYSRARELLHRVGASARSAFTLTSALSGSFTLDQLRTALTDKSSEIQRVESDTPGSLELDVARITVGLPPGAEELEFDGDGQVIAILDGEIPDHPSIAGRVQRKSAHSKFRWGEGEDNAAETFARGHALVVASIIAGTGSSITGPTAFRGICPAATLWNYKIAPSTTRGSDVVTALETALLDGAKIVNLSWGKKDATIDGGSLWSRTVDAMFLRGVLVCKSAGNTGPSSGSITAPADARNVVAVGAADRAGLAVHTGSSVGPTADGRKKPDIVAPGGGTRAAAMDGGYSETPVPSTSFAAPFAAAAAALLWQAAPTATVEQIRSAILAGSQPMAGAPDSLRLSIGHSIKILRASI